MGIKSTAKGRCMVNVAWEEQANGPEGAYCRVAYSILIFTTWLKWSATSLEIQGTEGYLTAKVKM